VITAFYRSVYQNKIALCIIMNMSVKKCQSDIFEDEQNVHDKKYCLFYVTNDICRNQSTSATCIISDMINDLLIIVDSYHHVHFFDVNALIRFITQKSFCICIDLTIKTNVTIKTNLSVSRVSIFLKYGILFMQK